ncbi:MAG: acyl-CoA dehydratase activase [Sulfurospirillaceae bacterium]
MYWGVDVGSTYTKIACLDRDKKLIDHKVLATIIDQDKIVKEYIGDKPISMLVATGYGRFMIEESFGSPVISEIRAHAKGAHFLAPKSDMVIDLGGQDSKVIKLDKSGGFVDFRMNDKCAAGTGKFLEIAANRMGLDIEKFANLGFEADKELTISSMCAVFAESEVVSLIAKKEKAANICYGIHESIASRLASMARQFARDSEFIAFTGGGALNPFLKQLLHERLEREILTLDKPQFVGSIGAALVGLEAC